MPSVYAHSYGKKHLHLFTLVEKDRDNIVVVK